MRFASPGCAAQAGGVLKGIGAASTLTHAHACMRHACMGMLKTQINANALDRSATTKQQDARNRKQQQS
jgi:GH43 family beta-xylosidase